MAMIPLTGKNPSIDSIIGIDISNPQDGQAIVYDAASGTWKNANAGGGGGGGGVLVVNGTTDENFITTLDKTAGEIVTALENGVVYVSSDQSGIVGLITAYGTSGEYEFTVANESYTASTADDYPTSGGIQ